MLVGLLALIAEEVAATPVRRDVPCPCTADGVCRPNRREWGYYHTNWRRWPGDTRQEQDAGADDEASDALQDLPGFSRPDAVDEDLRGPAKSEREESNDEGEPAEALEEAGEVPPLEPAVPDAFGPAILPQSGTTNELKLPIAIGVTRLPARVAALPLPPEVGSEPLALPVVVDPFEESGPAVDDAGDDLPPILPPSLTSPGTEKQSATGVVRGGLMVQGTPTSRPIEQPLSTAPAVLVNPAARRVIRPQAKQTPVRSGVRQVSAWSEDSASGVVILGSQPEGGSSASPAVFYEATDQ